MAETGFQCGFKEMESEGMKDKLVYLRKDVRWEARYKKGVSPEGKTIYGAVYGSTKEEVLKRRSLITGAPEAAAEEVQRPAGWREERRQGCRPSGRHDTDPAQLQADGCTVP